MPTLVTPLLRGDIADTWKMVERLKPHTREDVRLAADSLVEIVEKRVAPWLEEAPAHGLDDPLEYDEIINDIPDMLLQAFFAPHFPHLHDPTPDELAEAFASIDLPDIDPVLAHTFYESWRADVAYSAAVHLACWGIKHRAQLTDKPRLLLALETAAEALPSDLADFLLAARDKLRDV